METHCAVRCKRFSEKERSLAQKSAHKDLKPQWRGFGHLGLRSLCADFCARERVSATA
ncbi:alpha-galactosidase [Lacticaseibacillus paracasei]|nr:alpha-galactosidase [Lacticaseibacillus paracasei]